MVVLEIMVVVTLSFLCVGCGVVEPLYIHISELSAVTLNIPVSFLISVKIYHRITIGSFSSWRLLFLLLRNSVAVWFFVLWRDGGVIVQSLRHQVQGQAVFSAAGLLDFGPLVLKPDLDLGLVQAQLLRQVLPPLLRQVPICLELRFESLELLRCEGRPWSLVLFAGRLLLWFARSRPCWCVWGDGNILNVC